MKEGEGFMKKKNLILIGLLAVGLAMGTVTFSSMADEIEDAKTEKDALEQKRTELKDRVLELEEDKEDIVVYIQNLDQQLGSLNEEIIQLGENITNTKEQLEISKQELKDAKAVEKSQYETMKKRIKYMYENGNSDYLEILLEAGSFAEFLNRAEYIQKISQFDSQLLNHYKEAKKKVSDKKKQINVKLEQLESYNKEKELEQSTVEQLVANKEKELERYNENINASKEEVQRYANAIEEQENKIDQLLEEERKRVEAERKQAEDKGEDYTEVSPVDLSSSNGFRWPLSVKGTITSYFGPRKSPTAGASSYHKGLDIAAPMGTPILAAASGKVITATYQAAAGNYVMIYHGNDTYTAYMHASKLNVSVGDTVNKGDVVAYVGSTGVSTGAHLHFGVMVNGSYVNPQNYISQ